ncbi:MAG: hypothetical protein EBZ61_05830 [Micrococcales bacterium]|nr:hypothetical protein [Micrococcales bacterium]
MPEPTFKIGFLINPIAGMGGAVALHGTDADNHLQALARGARPLAFERAIRALQNFNSSEGQKVRSINFIAPLGQMGGDLLNDLKIDFLGLSGFESQITDGDDTRNLCQKFIAAGVDLILFAGGDGTARDVYSVAGSKIPMLGIPAGVKMRSSVFTHFPEGVSQILQEIESREKIEIIHREILDAASSDSTMGNYSQSTYYGVASSIKSQVTLSSAKAKISLENDPGIGELVEKLAAEILENSDELVLIGSGTTTFALKKILGPNYTLQGIDASYQGRCIGQDLTESQLLEKISLYKKVSLITGVIGGQGFLFGRGNQQLSARVIDAIGWSNIYIIAAEAKLLGLFPVELFVDLDSNGQNQHIPTFVRVHTSQSKDMLVRLRTPLDSITKESARQLVRSGNE